MQLIELLKEKDDLENQLSKLVFGSLEIRDGQYIYVHFRESGILKSRYAGEYSEDLYNAISKNNIVAR